MVRTYAYNPSSQGNFFGSTSTPSLNQQAHQQAKEVRISDVELVPVRNSLPPAQNEQSYTQQAVPACPCQLPQPFYTPFHSPYVDPIGSIVGLRVLYLEGKLCYVPIEPQLNYIINQQFGNGLCMHMGNRYLSQKDDFRYVNNYDSQNDNQNNQIQRQSRYEAPPAPNTTKPQQEQYATGRDMASTFATISTKTRQQDNVEEEPPWLVSHPQPRSGVRRSQLWRGDEPDAPRAPAYAPQPPPPRPESRARANSLKTSYAAPVVEQSSQKKQFMSAEEQYKAELERQIEESRRRRELEKQKEKEEEEREIRRLEKYNEKIRQEEEAEKRKQMERAKAMEKHSAEVREANLRKAKALPRREVEVAKIKEPVETGRDSPTDEAPRLEWWEKKPTWQLKLMFPMEEDDRRSAVIPSLRGKPPPRTPSASRQASRAQSRSSRHSAHSYDPVASVERHQSVDRAASRASQRSERENERRNSSSSRQRSSSRSSRRASVQSSQAKPAVDRQHLQESYEVPDAGGGGVATDAYGRPTSFTIM